MSIKSFGNPAASFRYRFGSTVGNRFVSFSATGGDLANGIAPGNGYKYHTFGSSGSFVANYPGTIEILIVAPGGGGGSDGSGAGGGGGGAGGGGAGSPAKTTPGGFALENTGSGGGGGTRNTGIPDSGSPGGNGGSGIVIIAYPS